MCSIKHKHSTYDRISKIQAEESEVLFFLHSRFYVEAEKLFLYPLMQFDTEVNKIDFKLLHLGRFVLRCMNTLYCALKFSWSATDKNYLLSPSAKNYVSCRKERRNKNLWAEKSYKYLYATAAKWVPMCEDVKKHAFHLNVFLSRLLDENVWKGTNWMLQIGLYCRATHVRLIFAENQHFSRNLLFLNLKFMGNTLWKKWCHSMSFLMKSFKLKS